MALFRLKFIYIGFTEMSYEGRITICIFFFTYIALLLSSVRKKR